MPQLTIAEAKTQFSEAIHLVESGEDIIVTRGSKREPVAAIIPIDKYRAKRERKLGTLSGKMEVIFRDDWYMTDEELLAS